MEDHEARWEDEGGLSVGLSVPQVARPDGWVPFDFGEPWGYI